ncbi:MAG: type II secretion system F family protein [Parcubacteria group bacterium]|nr:type II secretion system F family protein [Parcubacteria group bacterium]
MEETVLQPSEPAPNGQAKSAQNPASASSAAFDALEKKLLYPEGINQKFDQYSDVIRTVSAAEKIFFAQNLGVMLKSGLSASRSFRTLALQSQNPKFQRAMIRITRAVEKGDPIAAALEQFPKIFSPIFVNMVRAGEKAGQLEQVLQELTSQLKRSNELRQKVRGAMMYPTAVLIAMVLIGSGMIIFVIPKLLAIFEEVDAELPLPTRILILVSDTINEYILFVGPLAVLGAVALTYLVRRGPLKGPWHGLLLKLPVIAAIAVKINLAKIARTLSSLLATDMPIVDSFRLTAGVVGNVHYQASLLRIGAAVEKGETVASAMARYAKLYPPIAQQMVQVGEETGAVDEILGQLAQFYEEDVSQTMESLPTIIEPILILVLGGAVGAMAVSVIMPMFSLANAV